MAGIKAGRKFGELTVLGPGKFEHQHRYWRCQCQCGNVREMQEYSLRSKKTNRCCCKFSRKVEETNLGLALLSCHCIPGVPLCLQDIAAWAGVSRQAIEHIERTALHKLRRRMDSELFKELREALSDRTSARQVENTIYLS